MLTICTSLLFGAIALCEAPTATFAARFTFDVPYSAIVDVPVAQFDEPYHPGMFVGAPARREERA